MRDSGGFADFERLVLQQAVTVVALELMRRRVVRDTERRLAWGRAGRGAVRSFARGRARGPHAPVRRRRGVRGAPVRSPRPAQRRANARADARRPASVRSLQPTASFCARWPTSVPGSRSRLRSTRASRAAERHGEVRAAASRRSPVETLRRSFHEARCALEVSALRNGDTPAVASYHDLGAFQFLLSAGRRGASYVLRERAWNDRGR